MRNEIETAILSDGDVAVTVLSMGCAVQDWQVAGRRVVLGYAAAEAYRDNPVAMGAICGRVANRISNARFQLDGTVWTLPANDGPHHLHGGPGGLGRQNWQMRRDGTRSVTLTLHSPHLNQGYPGAVDFTVALSLTGHSLRYDMRAVPDRTTPVNLAQHIYFNLAGTGTVLDHNVQIDASHYTPNAADLIPTGRILPVSGTHWDFREPRHLRSMAGAQSGWDGNLVLDGAAHARVTTTDMQLTLRTDQPGLQLYTANALGAGSNALPGPPHAPFGGLCLEAQGLPNALNTKGFGNILCSPDRPYRQITEIEIAPL